MFLDKGIFQTQGYKLLPVGIQWIVARWGRHGTRPTDNGSDGFELYFFGHVFATWSSDRRMFQEQVEETESAPVKTNDDEVVILSTEESAEEEKSVFKRVHYFYAARSINIIRPSCQTQFTYCITSCDLQLKESTIAVICLKDTSGRTPLCSWFAVSNEQRRASSQTPRALRATICTFVSPTSWPNPFTFPRRRTDRTMTKKSTKLSVTYFLLLLLLF